MTGSDLKVGDRFVVTDTILPHDRHPGWEMPKEWVGRTGMIQSVDWKDERLPYWVLLDRG